MTDSVLSAQQLAVISALSTGATMTDAADQACVHRNTIANWRRNFLPFQYALAHAQYDRALLFREKAEALLEQVGLGGLGGKYPWQLSGGMLQRASLCRALVHEPELLLLDDGECGRPC